MIEELVYGCGRAKRNIRVCMMLVFGASAPHACHNSNAGSEVNKKMSDSFSFFFGG